jgi:hypothetical protein
MCGPVSVNLSGFEARRLARAQASERFKVPAETVDSTYRLLLVTKEPCSLGVSIDGDTLSNEILNREQRDRGVGVGHCAQRPRDVAQRGAVVAEAGELRLGRFEDRRARCVRIALARHRAIASDGARGAHEPTA